MSCLMRRPPRSFASAWRRNLPASPPCRFTGASAPEDTIKGNREPPAVILPGSDPTRDPPTAGRETIVWLDLEMPRRVGQVIAAVLLSSGSPGFGWVVAAEPVPAAAHEAADALAGRPLADVLRDLQSGGLAIVFTGEVVRPEMKVRVEPSSRDPLAILQEILAPHALEAREGPDGVLIVIAASAGGQTPARIEGRVIAAGDRRGLAGAAVRVLETGSERTVDAEGRFSLESIAPGRYTLEAVAAGFLDQRVRVSLASAAEHRVVFRLHSQPYLEEEIVVRPSRLTLLGEGSQSSFPLGRDDIERLPHLGDDVFRATSMLPGTAANDVTAQFSVHGGRRDEVKILLDGQELYEAHHLKDYDSALSIVSAQALAVADLSTGAYPASQGDRMSGVLDLRTSDPPPGRRHRAGASVLDVQASSTGTFSGERAGWLVTGRRGSIDLAQRFLDDEDPSFWDVFGRMEIDTGVGLLSARALVASDELEVAKADEEGFEHLENDYRSSYGWITHQGAPGARLLLESSASWAGIRRDRGGVASEEEGSFALRDQRDLEVLGLSQSWSYDLGDRHFARWGGELRRYDAAFDYEKVLDPELVILAPFSPPRLTEHAFAGDVDGDHLGLWASDRATLGDRLSAEAGLRFDRHTASGDEVWSPRLNLAFRVGERGVLRGGWGRFFQSQRPYELQVEDGRESLFPAELSVHSVLGYETRLRASGLGLEAVRLEVYRRAVEDPRPTYENLLEPLNVFPETEPDRVLVSPERRTAEGVELLLRGRRGDRFAWWLAYAYARAEDRVVGVAIPRSLDQPHTLVVDVDRRLGRRWHVNVAWRYHSGWPTTPVEAFRVPDPDDPEAELVAAFGALRSERLALYHRLDVRASRQWDVPRGRLVFFVDVQNLYDRRNLAGFDVELDEDAGSVLLEEERWPGIFPSMGLSWEF